MENEYLALDSARIVATVDKLSMRINERFPESGLSKVVVQVSHVALKAKIESLTTGFSRKIWQKLMIVYSSPFFQENG